MNNETVSAGNGSDMFDKWCASFNAAVAADDSAALGALFAEDSYWRDMLTLDERIQTAHGPAAIADMFAGRASPATSLRITSLGDARKEKIPGVGDVEGKFVRYETDRVLGHGYLRLGSGLQQAFTLVTAVRELKGYPEKSLTHRDSESHRSGPEAVSNWLDKRVEHLTYKDRDPQVLIVGAGHAGLTVAARLQHLGVDALIIDRSDRVGDNWRSRYHSLTLHNEICCNHLPYMPFPESWPVFLPKDKLAGWLEYYAEAMELNVWNRTTFLSGEYDEAAGRWTARVEMADGSVRTMHPSHVIMAIGVSGIPNIPVIPGQDDFRGQILHSSAFNSDVDVAGKAVVVVGAGTSAHDIAQDVYLRGGKPVLVQRSSVTVVSVEQSGLAYGAFRRFEGQQSIEETDLMVANPFDLVRRVHGELSKTMAEGDADLLRKLEKVGFLLDNGEDDTGFFMKLIRSLSGYYLNVGASDLIIEGKIGLRAGVRLESLGTDTAILSDGTQLEADLVVLGTGYRPLQDAVGSMFGPEVAEKVGPIWGLGPDNEMMGMWARTGQPGFFVAGGTFTMSRFYSRLTALLIKSDLVKSEQNGDREHLVAA
ncbi:NAD(P)/FAD-dependent oxidoreductase [Sphingobium sp. JS3065]|uniref:NAD(P)-binding domain-containing protein n=1 Tax=Sphingobium sp. JS3065 TaxID=2970925 RepID=UPI0022651372|nr:NAD(P)/FAD-dependent oxidoreductase [Sphingobium sp. JS3065]UZW57483.1 NAD(P)/FAD-dependent oxidoreductase [Sphingobium sp. JS3065]